MAELLVKRITEMSYRECAAKVSEMTGQTISAMGEWNVIQALGENEFHEYREAVIAQKFNLNEVSQRILNADEASWIRNVKDKSTCFQLDPFHRNKAMKDKIKEVFGYLEIYRNRLCEEKEIQDEVDLIRYYENNKACLLFYQSQRVEYGNMGAMENYVWSAIAKRMKYVHRSWSR